MQSTLEKLNAFITLQNEERSVYTKTYDQVLNLFLTEMKTVNLLFKTLSNGHILAGSYLDNLKISKPDEFDVNIQLKLPMHHSEIIITKSQQRDGYITINIKKGLDILSRQTDKSKTYSDLIKLTDNTGFLLQNKVHSWLEGVVVKALDSFKKLYPLFQITHTKSGPAHTLNVNGQFSIDLVAGFVFKSDHHWISDRKKPPLISSWLAIPRPYKANTSNNNQNWIPAYAMLEKDKIHRKNTFKNAIRLFKKLRDNLNLCNLKSYFIKTVFLWELDRRPANYWEQSLTQIFFDSFDALIDCIERREIKYYWDANYNMLLASLTVHQVDDLGIRLKRARNAILENKDTPESFINQFLTADEREQYKQGVRPKNDDLVSSMTKLMISGFNNSTTQNTINNPMLPSKDLSDSDIPPKANDSYKCVIS